MYDIPSDKVGQLIQENESKKFYFFIHISSKVEKEKADESVPRNYNKLKRESLFIGNMYA